MTRCTFTFLLCVCASFFLHAQRKNAHTAAAMTFLETSHDYDTVLQGEMIAHRFTFMNSGNQPLVITEVQQSFFYPDTYDKEPVAPGDSGFILVQFNTAGKSGPFVKTVTVRSNSAGGDVVLTIRGYIQPQKKRDGPVMTFDSSTYSFDTVTSGTIIRHDYRFTNTGNAPLIITLAVGSYGGLITEYSKEPLPPGKQGAIKVKYDVAGKSGPQDHRITVESNSRQGNVTLRITGYVEPGK